MGAAYAATYLNDIIIHVRMMEEEEREQYVSWKAAQTECVKLIINKAYSKVQHRVNFTLS